MYHEAARECEIRYELLIGAPFQGYTVAGAPFFQGGALGWYIWPPQGQVKRNQGGATAPSRVPWYSQEVCTFRDAPASSRRARN